MSTPGGERRVARGWFALVVVVLLGFVGAGVALIRNHDTQRLNDENRRLNAENIRLNGCMRDLVSVVNKRSEYTAKIDAKNELDREQDALDRKATRDFWTGVASTQDQKRRLAIFETYRVTGAKIEVRREQIADERDVIIAQRDAHKFPSLAECQ